MFGAVRREAAVLGLALGQILAWSALFYAFPALLDSWTRDEGWTRGVASLGLSLALIAAAICAPMAGRQVDRGRAPGLLGLGALAGGCGMAALAAVAEAQAFLAVWSLIGAAMAACLYEPCFALIVRARPATARRDIGRVTLVAGFATALAFPLWTGVADEAGWRVAALGCAAMAAFGAAPLLWLSARALERERRARIGVEAFGRATPAGARAPDASKMRARLRAGALLAAGTSSLALGHGMLLAQLPPLLAALGAASGVAAAAALGPCQVAGRLALLRFGRTRSATGLLTGALLAAAVASACLLALGPAAPDAAAWTFVALQGASFGAATILRPAAAAELLGEAGFGAISGRLATPWLASFAAAPALGGWLWQAAGPQAPPAAALALAVAGAGCLRLAVRGRPAL